MVKSPFGGAIHPHTKHQGNPVERNGKQSCAPSPCTPLPGSVSTLWEGDQQAILAGAGARRAGVRVPNPRLLVRREALHPPVTSDVARWRTAWSLVCSGSGKAIQIKIPSSSVPGLYTVARSLPVFQSFFGVYSLAIRTKQVS